MDTLSTTVTPVPNPWKTMWFSPRVTIRSILIAEERPSWMPVVALAVASAVIAAAQADESGAFSVSRSAMPMILSGIQLVYGVIIAPFLAAFVGGWFGGDADPTDIREAFAWGYVPIAAGAVLWIPIMLTLGMRAFAADAQPLAGLEWIGACLLIAVAITNVWTTVLQVGGLAAAQRFSIGKAILCVIVLAIPLVFLAALA